ncbi:extracellular solute-binding protein [Lactiplantibacillus pentosus]|jgi:iron(III) transport system substrate-binding protein|uniref:extracellular solute-binding protein n=1 Tax=Lactiplantibacillus pentosus TaxID=1589 RepID=UPI00207A0B39|nr:extracellular solute-binding protein [Lactiplantibacillus pentosus]USJ87767.1 extracellular solute-binding protein [Lactiplantibacillus pentosus]
MSKLAIITLSTLGVLTLGATIYTNSHRSKAVNAASNATEQQTLTVYAAGPKPLSDQIIKGFEHQTGIKIKSFDGTTGKILSKVKAEQANPQADVLILASMAAGVDLQRNGQLLTYHDAKRAQQLNPAFQDKHQQLFSYSASAVGITYNKQQVKVAPTDWSDLTKPEFRNQVTIPDPQTSGSSLDFINTYQMQHGNRLLKALKQNGAEMGGANKEVLDAVVTGQKAAVFGGVDYMSIAAIKKGERIGFVYPKSGTLVNPRPAMILKSSRHQTAAKKFVDYLLSAKVQQQVEQNHLIAGTTTKLTNPLNNQPINTYRVNWQRANTALTDNLASFKQVFN